MNKRNLITILREEDIEGLIALGAPQDEYIHEAEELFTLLSQTSQNYSDVADVYLAIVPIWQKSFNLSDADMTLRRPDLEKLATRICGE